MRYLKIIFLIHHLYSLDLHSFFLLNFSLFGFYAENSQSAIVDMDEQKVGIR